MIERAVSIKFNHRSDIHSNTAREGTASSLGQQGDTDAVIVVFNAAMVDALSEEQKRRVLKESGEFARWERARAETPEE